MLKNKNKGCRQYWSSEQICLELKAWMSSFLNIKVSCQEVSCKKLSLKISFRNSLENIRTAIFTLIKFQIKGLQLYWKETPRYVLF